MQVGMLILALLMLVGPAQAAPAEKGTAGDYKGIWISTPFPSFNASAGETVTLDLAVHNAGRPPQRVALQLERPPEIRA